MSGAVAPTNVPSDQFCFTATWLYTIGMAYDFKPFEKRIAEITEQLAKEMAGIRTGRAALGILDDITIESYGSQMPVNQVATISVEDPRTIRVAPWDASQIKEIEKAVTVANLGVSVGSDEKGVRIFFPEPTGERRIELVRLAKERLEEIRKELRAAREAVWSELQQLEKDGLISEDEKFRGKDDMQKRVDAANAAFEATFERKEKEISE